MLNEDNIQAYLKNLGNTSLLSAEEEVDLANNEDINVGDKVKLNINTTPNEGKAYVKAEVSSSGEVRSIYSERLVTFDENGNFTDVSSSSITSSYDNTSLVGVKFDVVIYVKDIAGNESVKYIPSIIKQ